MYLEKIRKVSAGIEVNQSNDAKELLKLAEDAEVLLAGRFSLEMFLAAKKLKWIQINYAGVESFLYPEVVKSDVIITNAKGVNAIPVAEHAIGLMFCLNRKLHLFIRNQVERRWKTSDLELLPQMNELSGKTLNSGNRNNRRRNSKESKVLGDESDCHEKKPFCTNTRPR
jgi:phosphoglycerate dehydrogenase-like enzyme